MSFPPNFGQGARLPTVFQDGREEVLRLPKPVDTLLCMPASVLFSDLDQSQKSDEYQQDLMEYESWLQRFTVNDSEFKSACEELPDNFYPWVKKSASSSVSLIMEHLGIPAPRIDLENDILAIYRALLLRIVSSNKQINSNLIKILTSHSFSFSLLAFSWEIYLLSLDSTLISFESLIKALSVSPVDFWKQIKYFESLAIKDCKLLSRHIALLEEKILFQMIWNDESSQNKNFVKNCKLNQSSSVLLKLNELLSKRIDILSDFFKFDKTVRNSFWSTIKYFITVHSDTLKGRSLDYAIFCTLLGLVKLNILVHVNPLLSVYCDLVFEDKLPHGLTDFDDLNYYYNEIYIYHMRHHLVHNKILKSWKLPIYFSRFITNNMLEKLPVNQTNSKVVSKRQDLMINTSKSKASGRRKVIKFNFNHY